MLPVEKAVAEAGKAQVVRESVPLADKAVAEVGRRQPGAAESSGIEELTADPGNTGIGSQQTVCPLPTKEYQETVKAQIRFVILKS